MKPRTMPIPVSGWDASRPAGSFRAFAGGIHAMAREVLLRDGRHAEMFFFMPLDGDGHVVLWGGNDRDLAAEWLRRHVREQYAYGVVHVCEAWMRAADGPDDDIFRQVMSSEVRVSQLPREERREALMVSAQSRDGWANSWVDEMLRDGDGRISLGGCREFADFRGRFGGLFG